VYFEAHKGDNLPSVPLHAAVAMRLSWVSERHPGVQRRRAHGV